jgi:hypothetical protein
MGRTHCPIIIMHVSQKKRGVTPKFSYTYVGLPYVNIVVAKNGHRSDFKINIEIILEYILLGVCTSIIFPGSAWFLRAEPQNWALDLCWFPLPIHAETLSHKLVIFCALVTTNTSPMSCLWDWWFLKWLIHSQGSGVKFTQKTLYSYVHKFKLGIQGFRSDQRVL